MRKREKRLRKPVWYAGTCAILLAATGCGSASPSEGSGGVDTLSVRLDSDWDSLDPARAQSTYGYQVIESLYDRLVAVEDGKVVPYLAKSWTQEPDSVTFTLRSDVTCGDGRALDADAVAASLKRLGDPETQAPYARLVFGGAGYTVTADNAANRVTVQTAKPFSDLLYGLAQPMASIVCPAGLAAPAELAATPAGSGPYTLASSARGSQYTLKARPGYRWGPETGQPHEYPAHLVFRVVQNQSTAANLLGTGELGVAYISGADIKRLQDTKSLTEVNRLGNGSYFLAFNQADGHPGQDPRVRRALASAVDASSFNKSAMFGTSTVAGSVFSPSMPCHKPVQSAPLTGDAAAARKALQAAGWSGESGALTRNGNPLRIKLVGSDEIGSGLEYLQTALQSAGAEVTLQRSDMNTLAETLFGTGDWDAVVYPFTPLGPTPSALSLFVSGPPAPNGTNFASIHNGRYDSMAATALSSLGQQRCDAWGEAQQALSDNADVFPLVHLKTYWFSSAPVKFTLGDGGTTLDIHSVAKSTGAGS